MIAYDFLLGVSVLVFIGVAIAYLRHPAASLLHPATIYLGFHGLVFVVRPILARIFDYHGIYRAFQFQPSIGDKITVILGANLGFLVYMGVSLWVAHQPLANRQDRFDAIQLRAMRKPFLVTAFLLLPICMASAIAQWSSRAMMDSTMITDAATGLAINTTGNGWFSSAQLALVPLSIMFAWMYRFRLWSLLPFAAFFVLRAGTGGRGPLIVAALGLAMLYIFEKRARWPEWRSALLLIAAAYAFTVIVADRGKAVREIFIADVSLVHEPVYHSEPFETMDFANQEFFEYLVYAVPQRTGTYDYFLSNLQIFTEPIPRVWWAGKPIGPPIQRFSLFEYGHPLGMTLSLPGAGWIELGFLGIVIQCGAFAAGYAWLYRFLVTRRQSNLYLITYCMLIAPTVITYRDGVLITAAKQVPVYIGPIVLVWLFMRLFKVPSALSLRKSAARPPTNAGPVANPPFDGHMAPSVRRKLLAAQDAGI